MKTTTCNYLLRDARKALQEHRLLLALDSLKGLAGMLKDGRTHDETEALAAAYQSMLDFFARGVDDPARQDMYRGFVRRAYEISDVLEREIELADGTAFFATALKTLVNLSGNPDPLSLFIRDNAPSRDLFDAVWLSAAWTAEEENAVADLMLDEEADPFRKCLVLSAATLGAMRFFDIAKYRLLLDHLLSPDIRLRVRALAGLAFVHIAHPDRLPLYPEAEARLLMTAEADGFVRETELLQTQLLLSLETKRIERSLQEEIIPQMMRRMENLRLDRSLGIDGFQEKPGEEELNPEWDNGGEDTKLDEYMNELAELQSRGADMYMSSFKMLKGRFPFFRTAANWFWPFTLDHPEVPEAARESRLLGILLAHGGLCDSDKYSFSLIAGQIYSQGDDANPLQRQMLESMSGLHEGAEVTPPTPEEEFSKELRSYVHGFYRFCTLFAHREAFVNPFKRNLLLADYVPFSRILTDEGFTLRMADFVFKDKAYALALDLYNRLSPASLTAAVWQRTGFCHEQAGDAGQARRCYERAAVLQSGSRWTLRRLAACQRATGDYAAALKTYDELAGLCPDDAEVALRQAECLMRQQRYEEAFKFLYKADYLSPESGNATRALAWCSLLTAKYEQAERHYRKILEKSPTPEDYLNAGHAAWLGGNPAEALARYRKALDGADEASFFADDREMLLKAGLSADDLAMMTDALKLRS